MSKTNIEWASHTLNFYDWHCNKVSPGCANCYAESQATRYGKTFLGAPAWRGKNAIKELKALPSGAVVFCNSMSDTYHEKASPTETHRTITSMIHSIHNAAAYLRPDVTFLLLTKRPERALALSPYLIYPPNLWVGTSVENADYLWRLDYLLQIPAAGHFVSAEPLLSPINLAPHLTAHDGRSALRWVICGAESGGNRRHFSPEWARFIRNDCVAANVPFMFKQGSAFKPGQNRELDGRTWDETPFMQVQA